MERRSRAMLGVGVAAVLATALFAGPAVAGTTNLTQSNTLPDGPIYATVTIDVSGTTAEFTVDVNEAILIPGDNFGVQAFGFNSELTLTADQFDLPDDWSVDIPGGNLDGFGSFEIATAGDGSSRLDPLVFTITGLPVGTTQEDFEVANASGFMFAAHIAGFEETNEQTSAFFADGGVPEPVVLLMLGPALVGALALGRRWTS